MMKKIVEVTLVALLVAGVAGVYFRVIGAIPISVTSTQKLSTFDVVGEGRVSVVPDQATINLGISESGNNLKNVQEKINSTVAKIVAELKAMGVEKKDITTTNYNYYPDYQNKGRFNASANVNVVVREMDRVSEVMDLVGNLGLNSVSGPSFGLSEKLEQKTIREAREQAIAKAQEKAKELAGIAGMRLGRVINIQEGRTGGIVPMYARAEVMMDKAATPTPVEPGSSDVVVNVTLSYETL